MRARELMLTLMAGGALLAAAQDLKAEEEPLDPHTKQAVMGEIGNDALQLAYMTHGDPLHNGDLDLGVLITSSQHQVLATGAVMFGADIDQVPGLAVRFGPILYMGWLEGGDRNQVAAIGGGLSARYDISQVPGLGATIHAFFSPKVLTFGVARNFYDFLAGAEYRVNDHFTILAGYRWLKITMENQPDNKLLNEVYAGVRYRIK
jgi:hypothetical protein